MKTLITIPGDLFADTERLAKRLKKSRSQLYTQALLEFVARHADDRVTKALDEVVAPMDQARDAFASVAARRTLKRSDW